MELRLERRDLLHQVVGQPLPGDHREAGNVVDRLFRIELGALPARPVENVDHVAFEIEQPELEHGEQPHRAPADHHHIGRNLVRSSYVSIRGAPLTPGVIPAKAGIHFISPNLWDDGSLPSQG